MIEKEVLHYYKEIISAQQQTIESLLSLVKTLQEKQ